MPTKLVLVHQNVPDADVIIDALKGDCMSLRDFSTEERLTDRALTAVDGTIERIAFVWSNPGSYRVPFASSAECADNVFCDGFKADIKEMVEKAAASVTVDLVSCNLNPADVEAEISALESELSVGGKTVTFEYSIDQTGNGPDGNWIMESNGVDIEPVYFTEEIQHYTWILDASSHMDVNGFVEPRYDHMNGKIYLNNQDVTGQSQNSFINLDGSLKVFAPSTLRVVDLAPRGGSNPEHVVHDVVSYLMDRYKVIYIKSSGQLGFIRMYNNDVTEPTLLSSGVKSVYHTFGKDILCVQMGNGTTYYYNSVTTDTPQYTWTNVKSFKMAINKTHFVTLFNDGSAFTSVANLQTTMDASSDTFEYAYGDWSYVYVLGTSGRMYTNSSNAQQAFDTLINTTHPGAKIVQFFNTEYASAVVLDNHYIYSNYAGTGNTWLAYDGSSDTSYPIQEAFSGMFRCPPTFLMNNNTIVVANPSYGGDTNQNPKVVNASNEIATHGKIINVMTDSNKEEFYVLFEDGIIMEFEARFDMTISQYTNSHVGIDLDTRFTYMDRRSKGSGNNCILRTTDGVNIAIDWKTKGNCFILSSGASNVMYTTVSTNDAYGSQTSPKLTSIDQYGMVKFESIVDAKLAKLYNYLTPYNSNVYRTTSDGDVFVIMQSTTDSFMIGSNGAVDPQDSRNGGGGISNVLLPQADIVISVSIANGKFVLDGSSRVDFIPGKTYAFIQGQSSNTGHPISISEDTAGSAPTAGVSFHGTPGTIVDNMPAYTLYQVPADSFVDKRYFYCTVHGAAMGSDLKGVAGFGASSKMAHHFVMKNNFNDRLEGSITLHSTGSAPQYELITDDGYSRLGYGLKMDGSSAYYVKDEIFPHPGFNSGWNLSFWVKRVGAHGTLMYMINRHNTYGYSNIQVSSSTLAIPENQWTHVYIHGGGNEYNFENKWRGFWVYVNGVYKTKIGGGSWDRYIFGHKKLIFGGTPSGSDYTLDGANPVTVNSMGGGTMIADLRYMEQLISQDELTQIRTMNAQYYLPTGLTPKEQAVADLKKEFETDDSMTDADVDAALTRAEAVTAADGDEVNVKDVLDITAHKDDPVKSRKLRRAVIDLMFAAKASFQTFVSSVEDLNLDRDVVGRSKVKVFKKTAGPIVIEDEVDPDTAIHVPMSETDDEATLVVNGVTMTVRKTDLGYVIVEPSGELVKYGNGDVMYFQEGEVAFYKDLTLIFGSVTVIQMIGDIRYIFLPEVGQTARVVISDAESYDVERHSYNQYKVTILNSTDGTTGNEYLFYHETVQDILSEKVNFSAPPQAGGSAGDPYIYCLTQDNV